MVRKWSALGRHTNGRWYCRCGPKFKYFGRCDKVTEEEATKLYEAWIAEQQIADSTASENDKQVTIKGLADYYLSNVVKEGCKKNHDDKERYLRDFMKTFGMMKGNDITPNEVKKWLNSHDGWNNTTKNNALGHIKSVFNWLVAEKRITVNPLHGCKRPVPEVRSEEYVISLQEYDTLLPLVGSQYHDIIELLWETGARPSEILTATVAEYRPATHELVKREHKTAGKGKFRKILLNDRAESIIKARIATVGSGRLFSSTEGNEIKADVLQQYMSRRFAEAKITHPVCDYSFRHSFAVRMLEAGISLHRVAALLGNTVAVCEKHYAHTLERLSGLRDELQRASTPQTSG